MSALTVSRAQIDSLDEALVIVTEYYEAVGVMVREDRDSLASYYFGEGSGLWLAYSGTSLAGCIALRPLLPFGASASSEPSGEVKRLYVRPAFRGQGIADELLDALHIYSEAAGYRWLYLDSKDDLDVAIRFYRRRGYRPCERYNDNPQATIFMRRPVSTP